MAYTYIDPTRYDAESPITESLMTDIINNIIANAAGGSYTILNGSGTYSVPAGTTKLEVIMFSGGAGAGGGGGGTGSNYGGGGGGGAGATCRILKVSTTGGSSISYSCGSGGSGGAAAASGLLPGSDGTVGSVTTFNSLSTPVPSSVTVGIGGENQPGALGGAGGDGDYSMSGGNGGDESLDGGLANTNLTAVYYGDAASFGVGNNGGGGGAGASFSFWNLLDIVMPSGGDGGDGSSGSPATAGGNGEYASGGGGGGGGSGTAPSAGGNGGAGFILVRLIG